MSQSNITDWREPAALGDTKARKLTAQDKLYVRVAIDYWKALHDAVGIKVDSGLLTRLDEIMRERGKK